MEVALSQLALLPDGFSFGLQLKVEAKCVPATHVGASPLRRSLMVTYERSALPPSRKRKPLGEADVLDHATATKAKGGDQRSLHLRYLAGVNKANPRRRTISSAGPTDMGQVEVSLPGRSHLAGTLSPPTQRARPDVLVRTGCSPARLAAWLYALLALLLAWLSVCGLVLVALPKQLVATGQPSADWWSRILTAGFGVGGAASTVLGST